MRKIFASKLCPNSFDSKSSRKATRRSQLKFTKRCTEDFPDFAGLTMVSDMICCYKLRKEREWYGCWCNGTKRIVVHQDRQENIWQTIAKVKKKLKVGQALEWAVRCVHNWMFFWRADWNSCRCFCSEDSDTWHLWLDMTVPIVYDRYSLHLWNCKWNLVTWNKCATHHVYRSPNLKQHSFKICFHQPLFCSYFDLFPDSFLLVLSNDGLSFLRRSSFSNRLQGCLGLQACAWSWGAHSRVVKRVSFHYGNARLQSSTSLWHTLHGAGLQSNVKMDMGVITFLSVNDKCTPLSYPYGIPGAEEVSATLGKIYTAIFYAWGTLMML